MENKEKYEKIGLFLGGVVAGIVGLRALKSREAKQLMVNTTATTLRVKDSVLEATTAVQEGADDIIAEAKEVNRKKEEEDVVSEVSAD